jgi:hypothetical protein
MEREINRPFVANRTALPNTLMRFDFDSVPKEYHHQYPFSPKDTLLFLGEMPQMPGHCVVATKEGKVLWGYHTDNFIELTEDEL